MARILLERWSAVIAWKDAGLVVSGVTPMTSGGKLSTQCASYASAGVATVAILDDVVWDLQSFEQWPLRIPGLCFRGRTTTRTRPSRTVRPLWAEACGGNVKSARRAYFAGSGGARSVVVVACETWVVEELAANAWRVQCNGARPTCATCADKGTTCQYDASPGLTPSAARKEKVERLETEISEMYDVFTYLQSESSTVAIRFLERLRSGGSPSVEHMHGWIDEIHGRVGADPPPVGDSDSTKMADGSYEKQDPDDVPRLDLSGVNTSAQVPFYSRALLPRHAVTVATVRTAIDRYFESDGILFRVFAQQHVHDALDELLETSDIVCTSETPVPFVFRGLRSKNQEALLGEIFGIAAVGSLYLSLAQRKAPPQAGQAEYFYNICLLALDSAIEVNPNRAMQVAMLLAMYNTVLRTAVGLVYVGRFGRQCSCTPTDHPEIGLHLGRESGIDRATRPDDLSESDYLHYRRAWRSLLLFSRSAALLHPKLSVPHLLAAGYARPSGIHSRAKSFCRPSGRMKLLRRKKSSTERWSR